MRRGLAIALFVLTLYGPSPGVRGEAPAPANYALITDLHLSDLGGMPPMDIIVSRAKFCGAKWLGILGDTTNRPQDLRPTWEILSSYLTRTWGGPFFCVPGNHDVDSVDSLGAFRAAIGPDYFTLNENGCAFVFIDTPLLVAKDPNSPAEYLFCERERQAQWDWLEGELSQAAAEQRRIFLLGHHPPYVHAENEADDTWNFPKPDRARLLELCRRYGVAACFCGHLHRTVEHPDPNPPLYVLGSASYSFDERGTGFRLLQVTRAGLRTWWIRTDRPDTEPPTTPTQLSVKRVAGHGALVTWQPSTDESGIAFYRVFVNSRLIADRTIGEECMLDGIPAFASAQVSIVAVDPFGNVSGVAATSIDHPLPCAAGGWGWYE